MLWDGKELMMPRLIIILGLELQDWAGEKIGSPDNLEQAQTSVAAAKPAPAAAAPGPAAGAGAASRPAPARAPARSGKDMGPIFPIEGLSPYQNK